MDHFCDGSQPGNVTFSELTSANHLNTIVYTYTHMYISEFHIMYVRRVAVLSHDSFALLGHVMSNVMYCKGDIYVCTYTIMYAYLHHCIYWLYCGCSWVDLSMLSVSNALTMLKCHLEELAQNKVYFVH